MPKKTITKKQILKLLPLRVRRDCLIGIADPKCFKNIKSVFIKSEGQWTAKPQEFFPGTKSVIVLINFSPVAKDYRVEDYICYLGRQLFKKYNIRSHILDRQGNPDPSLLAGVQCGKVKTKHKKMFLLKDAAYFSGLGRFGKNSLLINNKFGSDFKIQALFVDTRLQFDNPLNGRRFSGCLDCRECIKACFYKAVNNTYKLNPYRCFLAYRQKENFNTIIATKLPKRKRYYYDKELLSYRMMCRACQAFCPVNKKHYTRTIVMVNDRYYGNKILANTCYARMRR